MEIEFQTEIAREYLMGTSCFQSPLNQCRAASSECFNYLIPKRAEKINQYKLTTLKETSLQRIYKELDAVLFMLGSICLKTASITY